MDNLENVRIYLQQNNALFFDSIVANVLETSQQFSYLSYLRKDISYSMEQGTIDTNYFSVNPALPNSEVFAFTGSGMLMMQLNVEMDEFQINHFRKTMTVWELLALSGGFSAFVLWLGGALLSLIRVNYDYIVSQEYLKLQYQSRTREMDLKIEVQKETDSNDEIDEEVEARYRQHKLQVNNKLAAKNAKIALARALQARLNGKA